MTPHVAAAIRVRVYEVVSRAVDEGIELGWTRAHRHVDDPEPEFVKENVATAVLGALCDVLDFEPADADVIDR